MAKVEPPPAGEQPTKAQKRITAFISSLGPGGAERNLIRVASHLASVGYRVTLLTIDPETPDFYEIPDDVIRVHGPSDAFLSCRWYHWRCQQKRTTTLRNALLETAPDLVLSFIDTNNVRVLNALSRKKIPVIVSERCDWRQHSLSQIWKSLRRFYYPFADRVVVLTQESVEVARRYWPKWKITQIPNPAFSASECDMELQSHHVLSGQKNIVAIGRLHTEKGFDLLIEAFAQSADEFPEWNLTILGEGTMREELTSLIERLNLSDRIALPGSVKSVYPILQSADMFVMSSLSEGFPNALMEAMSCGLPVISFDCPTGPPEIVRNGIDGLLVPTGDIQQLENAMRKLMRDKTLRAKFGSKAKEITGRYSVTKIMKQWEELIKELI